MLTIKTEQIDQGVITDLAVNGDRVSELNMTLHGPEGDRHTNQVYNLRATAFPDPNNKTGRHGELRDMAAFLVGRMIRFEVRNFRVWTAVSVEEMAEVATEMGLLQIPPGGMLENFRVSGFDRPLSAIPTGYQLSGVRNGSIEWVLTVTKPNLPCRGATTALLEKMGLELPPDEFGLFDQKLKRVAALKRGIMGDVLLPGKMCVGDEVFVTTPTEHPDSHLWRP